MNVRRPIAFRGLLAAMVAVAVLLLPASAFATGTLAPHVPTNKDTDVCSMCHRSHASASSASHESRYASSTVSNSLLAAVGVQADTGMCFVCHGVEALGSRSDVQTSFSATSAHSLWPAPSPYGSSPKQCGSCHDTHGSERVATDTPYPALLRARTTTNSWVYSGDEFCGACHLDRADDLWSGIDIWRQTTHARLATPTGSGTQIRCSICHHQHGSGYPPLVRRRLYPPEVPATTTVTGNDRTLCFACHSGARATYAGETSYAVSGHGSTLATWAASGEWVLRLAAGSADASRKVGECVNCHDPMGAKDASGALVPRNLRAAGRVLCDPCHDADGPARSNVASLAFPSTETTAPELVSVWRPGPRTSQWGRVALYSRDPSGTAPKAVVGPREYAVPGTTGEASAGDIDGNGYRELVTADASSPRLVVYSWDALKGISRYSGPGLLAIPFTAEFVEVGDFIVDGTGLPEVSVVDTSTAAMWVYRLSGSSLATVAGPFAPGTLPSGIAAGDVTGTAASDIVVTAAGSDELYIYTQSGGTLVESGPYATRAEPRGPSVGDAWAGGIKDEIAVANSGVTVGTVTIFDGSGVQLGSYDATGFPGAVAYDTIVADSLPGTTPAGTSGSEVVVALYGVTSTTNTGINVFAQLPGGALNVAARQTYASGDSFGSGSLAAGDLDGDGRVETVVGNSGYFPTPVGAASRDLYRGGSTLHLYAADSVGTALSAATRRTLHAGGGEFGGDGAPALVLGDLGPVGPTRHPVDAVPGVHVSTETPSVARHVVCVDCHDTHEASSTAAVAPDIYGQLRGEWGLAVSATGPDGAYTTSTAAPARYEYQVCFKCHGYAALAANSRDIASEVNSRNPGVHSTLSATTAVLVSAGTYVTGWGDASILHCRDCHGNSRSLVPSGTHSSTESPLLTRPYLGSSTSDPGQLCYRCHEYSVYYTGVADTAASHSNFWDPSSAGLDALDEQHSRHVGVRGLGCQACHVAHGSSTDRHLLRPDIGWVDDPVGADVGECGNACHGGTVYPYRG